MLSDLSCASSMMMALYWSRSGSRRDSLRRIPSVMYLMSVDWREEEGWRRKRRGEGERAEKEEEEEAGEVESEEGEEEGEEEERG